MNNCIQPKIYEPHPNFNGQLSKPVLAYGYEWIIMFHIKQLYFDYLSML